MRVGSRVAFVARFMGRQLTHTYEIVELVPEERLVMRTAEGPFPMETTYTWVSTAEGYTRMTLRNRGEPTGFSKLVAPIMVGSDAASQQQGPGPAEDDPAGCLSLVAVDLSNGVPVPDGSPFTLANLPFGVSGGRVHIAIGDHAVDVAAAAGFGLLDVDPTIVEGCRLDGLLAAGPSTWRGLREEVGQVLADEPGRLAKTMVDRATLAMELPVTVGDYVDGYAGLHHAINLGRILRPDGEPLQPNWRHLPVAYHGRSGTIVVGGGEIGRPSGQVLVDGAPVLAPSAQLDIELELGAIVGVANAPGEPIPVGEADTHLFGFVLVNDWSARDIQAWEYQPLGPFLGKSFATSVSPWVVTVDALAPHRVVGLAGEQEPPPLSYLRGDPPCPTCT